jgi:hypothetical protein
MNKNYLLNILIGISIIVAIFAIIWAIQTLFMVTLSQAFAAFILLATTFGIILFIVGDL